MKDLKLRITNYELRTTIFLKPSFRLRRNKSPFQGGWGQKDHI